MRTLYRIIDTATLQIVAEGMELAQAHETQKFYELDNPQCKFEIESYRTHTPNYANKTSSTTTTQRP
jgi:hypothetical protein